MFVLFVCLYVYLKELDKYGKYGNSTENTENMETYENKKCLHILERGKNRGKQCSRSCHIGMDYCLIHNKKHKDMDDNNTNNNGGQ